MINTLVRLASFCLISSLASAASITICNTGLGSANASSCGAAVNSPAANNLLPDGNWYAAANSSGTFLSQAFVTVNNSAPVQNAGPWLANNTNDSNGVGAGSYWITPSSNQAANFANGNFFYSTTFNLTGFNLANVILSGFWLADDYGGGIFLNGVAVGQASQPAFGSEGGPMVGFTITQGNPNLGQAVFNNGINTLTFGVVNDSTNHGLIAGGSTPTGLRVVFTTANDLGSGVPEPASLILAAPCLAILAWTRRRQASR